MLSNINAMVDFEGYVNIIYSGVTLRTRCKMVTREFIWKKYDNEIDYVNLNFFERICENFLSTYKSKEYYSK